jgi:protein-S-isoprenylcysteine O-methyltransferase Ste14
MFLIVIGIPPLIFRLFFEKVKYAEVSKRHGTTPQLSGQEKILNYLSTMILLAAIGYSVFLPLKLGTGWFYAGLSIYVIGMVFGFIAIINFGTAPLDEPVTYGVYRISRHPMYFSMFLIFIGIGGASTSWVFLLLTVIWLLLSDRGVIAEERWCLETYGDIYREYMNRTPRWIGPPKNQNKRK